jgi:MFS family permease
MLAAGMVLTAAGTMALPFAPGMVAVIVLMALVAFGQSVAYPNVSALITRAVDGERRGGFLGVNNASGAFARVAGPLAGGVLVTAGLYDGPFVLAAVITAPAIFLSILAGRAMMLHRAGIASRRALP